MRYGDLQFDLSCVTAVAYHNVPFRSIGCVYGNCIVPVSNLPGSLGNKAIVHGFSSRSRRLAIFCLRRSDLFRRARLTRCLVHRRLSCGRTRGLKRTSDKSNGENQYKKYTEKHRFSVHTVTPFVKAGYNEVSITPKSISNKNNYSSL